MNFNEAAMQQVGMDKQYIGQQNAFQGLGATAAPPETLSGITQESVKSMYELCSLLASIGDALGGPVPQAGDKAGPSLDSISGKAYELRDLIRRAAASAHRIGSLL